MPEKILIIDDEEATVHLIGMLLEKRGFETIKAYRAEEGLRKAYRHQPDLVLLDIMMPDMDGWEMLQRLRTSPITDAIPIVICSVINDPQLAYSLGASKFITKPVSKDNLFQALDELKL